MEIIRLDEYETEGALCVTDEGERRTEAKVTEHIHTIADLMLAEFGFEMPREEFPPVFVRSNEYPHNGSFDYRAIHIHQDRILETGEVHGSTASEEVMHWIHACVRRQANTPFASKSFDQVQWHEFVGFLGQHVFFTLAQERNMMHLFPSKSVTPWKRDTIKQQLRRIRERNRVLLELPLTDENTAEMYELHKRRYSYLSHHRPREFATSCDWTRIGDWYKFLSLSSQEGRRRFFCKPEQHDFLGLENEDASE